MDEYIFSEWKRDRDFIKDILKKEDARKRLHAEEIKRIEQQKEEDEKWFEQEFLK